jgi:hypothetical protein
VGRPLRLAFLLATFVTSIAAPPTLLAQSGNPPVNARQLSDAFARYYEKPFDIPQFLYAWDGLGRPGPDGVIGFLAGVFAKHPDRIDTTTTAPLNRQMQAAVFLGLCLADRNGEAKAAAERWRWPSERIGRMAQFRPLLELKAELPAHFDMFWGATFATGNAAYVRPIYDYYVAVVTQRDVDAHDILTAAMSKHRSDKSAMDVVTKKYPRDILVRVIVAASALWSLESNARQHKFVAIALDQYAKESPDSPAIATFKQMRNEGDRLRRSAQ